MKNDDLLAKEEIDQRQYQRLPSCFFVDFTIVRLQGDIPGINWEKGCTRNVSKTGLCLETSNLSEATLNFLNTQSIFLDLRIKVPLGVNPVKAVGEVVWFRKNEEDEKNQYSIGLHFRSITDNNLKTILRHARVKNFFSFFRSKSE